MVWTMVGLPRLTASIDSEKPTAIRKDLIAITGSIFVESPVGGIKAINSRPAIRVRID